MNFKQALAGLLQTLTVFSLFGAGLFFIALPHATPLRLYIADRLRDRAEFSTFIGLFLLSIALLFLIGFCSATSGKYLKMQMGVKISARVLKKTLKPALKKEFSQKLRLVDIDILREKHIELRVSLASMPQEEQVKTLREAEQFLSNLLTRRFGYAAPFTVQIVH